MNMFIDIKVMLIFRRNDSEKASHLWVRPLGVLSTALNLSEVITNRPASLEAEILLNIGNSTCIVLDINVG